MPRSLARFLSRLAHFRLARLAQHRRRHVSRRQLLDLDDRLLRDIGLTRDEARREGAKHFWE